ncbi:MAG: putative mannose-6-phosphate isomerase GmuF, partial [Verrucomicrobiota bacterium]
WRTYPGGRTLDTLAGAPAPADSHFAEDWIASTTVAKNPPGTPLHPSVSQLSAGTIQSRAQSRELRAKPNGELHQVSSESEPALGGSGSQLPALSSQLSTAPGVSPVRVGLDPTPHDFAALLASDPGYFLGAAHAAKFGAQPQLLVKFLDSGTRLHFQVHPTREFAQRFLAAPSGKTEAYHVLSCRAGFPDPAIRDVSAAGSGDPALQLPEPTGYIYVGFQRPPTRAQLRDWIATQNLAALEACFDKIPVAPGDTFIIPGGTPHALGAGLFLVEIQEPSDLVVRFEFERAGYVLPEASRFMGRGLDFCLDVFNLAPLTAGELDVRVRCRPRRMRALGPSCYQDELIGPNQTDCFRVLKTSLDTTVVKTESAPVVAIVTRGALTATVGGETHALRTYDKFFLPAALGPVRLAPAPGGCEILECLPPG